jgi:hypothetical protein
MAVLVAFLPTAGCYSYAPVVERSGVQPATAVALRVTDVGRVSLASRFGEGVRTIEGTLQSTPDSLVRLTVSAVQYLDGRVDKWTGESVAVPATAVGVIEARKVDKGRTWLAVAIGVGAVVLFIASRSLGVFGGVGTGSGTGGSDPS